MDVLPIPNLMALRELASLGTMSAAAVALNLTPGAISQQISVLESKLGVALVRRVGRGVELTDAGYVMLQAAINILDVQEAAFASLSAARTEPVGPVTIGLFGSSAGVLPAITRAVQAKHAGIEIRTREIDVDSALAAVRRGVVDLAFGLDYPDAPIPLDENVAFTPLTRERFGLAVSASFHPGGKAIDLAGAAQWPWILPPPDTQYGDAFRVACRRSGFEPRVVHEVTDTAASIALAVGEHGVTPVTPLMLRLASAADVYVAELKEDIGRSLCLAEPRITTPRHSVGAVAQVIRALASADRLIPPTPVGGGRSDPLRRQRR